MVDTSLVLSSAGAALVVVGAFGVIEGLGPAAELVATAVMLLGLLFILAALVISGLRAADEW